MPNDTTIHEQVVATIEEVLHIPREKITPEARIVEDLGADSLDTVTLLMSLEERFDHDISDEEATQLKTVQQVEAFISAQKNERTSQ